MFMHILEVMGLKSPALKSTEMTAGFQELPPNMAFERDAAKARRPSTLRYATKRNYT